MYVYSTVTASIAYKIGDKTIVIKGGANVTDKHMWTPKGVATKVTKDELEELRKIPSFASREANGYFSTSQFEKNPNKVADDMAGADNSAQADVEKLEKTSKAKKK